MGKSPKNVTARVYRLALATLLGLAACGTAPPVPSAPLAASAVGPTAGLEALRSRLDIDGKALPHPPRQPTVVVFFASWCGPCQKELAVLGELRAEIPTLQVIGINAYEEWGDLSDERRLREFLAENSPWLPVVRGDDALLHKFGGVPRIPTLFIYDHEGDLVREFRRGLTRLPTRDDLRKAVHRAKGRLLTSLAP